MVVIGIFGERYEKGEKIYIISLPISTAYIIDHKSNSIYVLSTHIFFIIFNEMSRFMQGTRDTWNFRDICQDPCDLLLSQVLSISHIMIFTRIFEYHVSIIIMTLTWDNDALAESGSCH